MPARIRNSKMPLVVSGWRAANSRQDFLGRVSDCDSATDAKGSSFAMVGQVSEGRGVEANLPLPSSRRFHMPRVRRAGTIGYTVAMADSALQPVQQRVERLAGGRVKGSMIRAHLDWVRDHASRDEIIELFETLPAEVRREVATVLAASWYDFATLIAVDRTILSLFGGNDERVLEQLGAYSAQKNLSGAY